MDIDYEIIGSRIREERTKRYLSQLKLSELADISPQYLCHIETGRKRPSLQTLINISEALRIDINVLLYGEFEESKNDEQEAIEYILEGCSDSERKALTELLSSARTILKKII